MWLAMKNVVFAVLVPGFVSGWMPVYLGGGFGSVQAFEAPQLIASILLVAAVFLILTPIVYFGAIGRGTPAPFDPPVRLVIRGPHRYVRNPMYVGSVLASLAWALLFESVPVLVYAIALWVLYHLMVVLYEEPTLQRLFGADYDAYRAAVHRWLPRVPR